MTIHVSAFPLLVAVLDGAQGTLSIAGAERSIVARDDVALRAGVIAQAARTAASVGRPVRLDAYDEIGRTSLAVHPSGVVQPRSSDDQIATADGLLPYTGPCRRCHRQQSVLTVTCDCGTVEPFRIDRRPTTLRLAIANSPALAAGAGAVLGRRPAPLDGHTPVTLTSPDQLLSRTHAAITLTDAGDVLVTDLGSSNGTRLLPHRALTPWQATPVAPGSTIELGDVTCTITLD